MTCTAGADERAGEGEARTDRGTAVGMPSQDRRRFHIIWRYRAVPDHEPRSRPGDRGFDPPEHIAAFLNALRWNCTTATDPSLFQTPLPAGIRIEACQSEPLRKAFRLPRVHLPIADDTGPGKTIQAGLIVRELVPRPAGPHNRRRRAAVGAGRVEGRDGGAFRPAVPDTGSPVSGDDPSPLRLLDQCVVHVQPLAGLAPPARRLICARRGGPHPLGLQPVVRTHRGR